MSTPRPARVLWLAKGLGRGGAERLLVDSVRHIDRNRFTIEIAYLLPWKDALVGEFEHDGVPAHCLGNTHPLDPRWVQRLRRLHAERRYDLIHTHMPYPALGARLALGGDAPPIVHTEHNVWERYRPPTRWANALTYTRNAAVIAVSNAVAESITSSRRSSSPSFPPVEVVVHGVSFDQIHGGPDARTEARDRLGLSAKDVVVGTVGNFTPKKDHATLLEAAARLARDVDRLRLVLIGSGPLEQELRARARALGLDSRIVFTGMRDDVLELLPGFDVFALSSRHEGLPIALLEAMATGLPCVVTRVGGVPEVVSNGVEGQLVEPDNPDQLAAALRDLLTNHEVRARMGDDAASRARDFDLPHAVRRTQEIYTEILSG